MRRFFPAQNHVKNTRNKNKRKNNSNTPSEIILTDIKPVIVVLKIMRTITNIDAEPTDGNNGAKINPVFPKSTYTTTKAITFAQTQKPKQTTKMKITPMQNRLQVFLQKLAAAINTQFHSKRKMESVNTSKPTSQQKMPTKVQHNDEIHWCNHERHGMFPVPREFLSRGRSDGGTQFSVFQCSDSRCREFVAAVIRNDNPDKSWVLFRGCNYRPRPERRVNPVLRVAGTTPVRATAARHSAAEPINGVRKPGMAQGNRPMFPNGFKSAKNLIGGMAVRAALIIFAAVVTAQTAAAVTYAITPNPASVSENAGSVTFTITRSGGTPAETIYATTAQTEGFVNNNDYTGILNQAVTFTAGQVSRTVTVTILNDTTVEPDETFGFIVQRNTSDPVTTYLAKSTFTILNDDVLASTYTITPNPATVNENVGSVTFTITRSGGTPTETIYATTAQTEGYANNGDYTGILNQAVTFTSGQTTRTVTVAITDDTAVETSETFALIVQRNASDPVTTYLAKTTFTITDNDVLPTSYTITPGAATVDEAVGTVTFTVNRSGGLPAETIYATTAQTEGYANNGDYTGILNQAVTFTSGQTTRTVTVAITDDTTVETSETFALIVQRNASDPVGTYLAKATFTITDNDVLPTTYTITPGATTLDEGAGTLTFTITRSGGTPAETIYATTTMTEGFANNSDYNGILNQAVTFTSGQTTRTVTVTINDDTTVENNETFGFIVQRNASDPVSTYLAKATFTITDNDVLPTTYAITPNATTVDEGGGTLTFTITRSGGLPAETVYGTTTQTEGFANNIDYTGILNQAVTFISGQTTRTVTVTIINDTTVENNETFGFIVQRNSTDPVSTYLAKATFTIIDNDVLPTTYAITPGAGTVDEGAGTLTFTITRSGGLPAETIYTSTTQTEGFSNNSDYTGIANQAVTFTSGQTTRTVTVTIINDTTVENNETFGFIVQRNANDPISTYLAKATFTITDNDVLPITYTIQGQIFDATTKLPLNNVAVLVNGKTTTTANGNYLISQLQSGGTLSASASGYITGYLQVNPPTGATLITLSPIYLAAQPVVSPNKPLVSQVSLKNPGIFFSGMACPNQIQFSVNWNGGVPGNISVYQNNTLVQNFVGQSGPTFTCNLDVGNFPPSFNPGANQILIQAVTAAGTLSDVATYPVSVIPAPSALQALLGYSSLLGNTDAHFRWGFQFPETPLSKTVNLPVLGEFGIQFGVKGKLDYAVSSGVMKLLLTSKLNSDDSNNSGQLENSSKLFFGDREIDWDISAEQDLLASPAQGLQFQDLTGAVALGGKIQIGQFGIADLLGPWAGTLISKIPLGDKLIDDVSISLFAKPECEGSFTGEWNNGLKFKQFQLSTTLGIEAVYEPEIIEHVHIRAIVGGQGTVVFGYPGDLFQSARIRAYAAAELQVWLYQTSAEYTFCDYTYPQMSLTSLAKTLAPTSSTDFQPVPRKGMEQSPSVKKFARASLSGLGVGANSITGNQSAAALLENVFSDAQPALAAKGAELMLLWEADGGITNNLSFTDIHFSHYDGTNWTTPQAILQDARAEFAPAVASSASNEFVAVWSRVHDANFTNMDFNAMSADMEIVFSYWNPSTGWTTPVELTTNSILDCAPLLAAMPDGQILLTWTRNTSNQFANSSSPSDVLFCLWNPTNHTWSTPQTLLSGVAFRQSQALATGNNHGIYAWAFNPTNAPGQIRFCEFTNGGWTAPTQFTTNVDGNQNVRAAISKSNDVYLVWQQGTNFVVSTNYNIPLAIPANIVGPDYQISLNNSGNLAAVFAQSSASGAAPFYTVFDAASSTWSHTRALRSDDGLSEHSVAPVFDGSGTLAFAYLATQIDRTNKTVGSIIISNAPVLGRTDLYVGRQTLFKDLALLPGNFILQSQTFLAGDSLLLIATATNSGNLAVSNLTLGFFDGDPASGGTRIATLTTTGAFEGGGQMQFSNSWVLPSSSVGHQIVALIDPDNAITDEFDKGNNSQALNLGVTNISLSLIYAKADTNGAVHVLAQFQNSGGLPVGNVSATLRRFNSTNILGTVSAPTLDPGRIAQLPIELSPGSQAAGQTTYQLSLDNATANSNTDTNNNSVSFVVSLFIDSDGDGIPDDWELAHGLNPNDPNDALLDPDHDGMSNLAEFRAGTDPNNASSFLKVEPLQFVGGKPSGGVQISWGSNANRLYTVMRSTNLANGFVPIMQHLSATPPTNSVIDTNTVGVGAAFYRIQVE